MFILIYEICKVDLYNNLYYIINFEKIISSIIYLIFKLLFMQLYYEFVFIFI